MAISTGMALLGGLGALGSVAASLATGWTWAALATAVEAGVLAAGGWSASKKLLGL